MRKSAGKNAGLDRGGQAAAQPLLDALRAAFSLPARWPAKHGKRRPQDPIPEAALHFEALEPRVLLSGDSASAILSIAGGIDLAGEQDDYRFDVEEPRRVVFDSLTNRSDLNWRLEGPAGLIASSSFSATDYRAGSSPTRQLAPGSYRLRVDGQDDAVGDYALRLIDAAAANEIAFNTPVAGILAHGNDSALYRFHATAGDSFFFKAGTASAASIGWRLIDPFGRQEGNSFDAGRDRGRFAVERSGEYLLLVEGNIANQAPLGYRFTLQAVKDSSASLRLGETAIATIDHAGQASRFTFDLVAPTRVVFDRLSDSDFYWSLQGPAGEHVARRLASSEALFDGFEALLLPPGNYTLSVDGDGANTGRYPFRLLGDESARTLIANSTIVGRLDFAAGYALHQITLAAGDKLFLDAQSLTGGSLDWRLIDPYGVRVAGARFDGAADAAPVTVASPGKHWLLLDGKDNNAADAAVSYEFAVNLVADIERTLRIGDVVAERIEFAGQSTIYHFDLASETQLAVDAQSNRADLVWSLTGPRGREIVDRRFDHSDGNAGFSVLTLPAGAYRLGVRGVASATGDFAFRLLDLAAAPALSLGTSVSGTLKPGNSTHAYRLNATAGDQVALQGKGVTGASGGASWRLVDRFGRDVSGAGATALPVQGSVPEVRLLTADGAYTLLIEGDADALTPISYELQLDVVGHLTPASLPIGEALPLGAVVAGLLPGSAASRSYRFTLARESQLVIDSQAGASSAVWSLLGPRGSEVDRQTLYSNDGAARKPLLTLPPGDYALTVEGAAPGANVFGGGAYALRLLDAASFPEIARGQMVNTTRSPTAATNGYRIAASAGSALLLQAADSAGGVWRLFDPFGRQVSVASIVPGQFLTTRFEIATTGSHTLLNDGADGANGRSNVSFTLTEPKKVSSALDFNRPISASAAGPGSVAEYAFTLDQAATLVFDALSGPESRWMLTGPLGTVQGWRPFRGDTGQVFRLPPGRYLLTLDTASQDGADYRFRVLNADAAHAANAATDLRSASTVEETIAAGETRLYRFEASAGDRAVLVKLARAGGVNQRLSWQLWDPYGRRIATLGEDANETTLPVSGEYLLAVFPDFGGGQPDNTPRQIAFAFALATSRTLPLTLDEDVVGRIERPGESVSYGLTLAAPTSLLVDTGDAARPDDFFWTLSGPRGLEGPPQAFANAHSQQLALPAGNYWFTVASQALASGDFSFALLDVATLPALAFETVVAATLAPASRAQAYSFELDEDSELLFVPTASPTRDGDWRLLDSFGRAIASGTMSRGSDSFALPAGNYSLVIDGRHIDAASDSYEFVVRRLLIHRQAITLNVGLATVADVADRIDQPGQVREYSFSIDSPTTIVFDALTDRDDLSWQLVGPTGLLGKEDVFGGAGIVRPILLDAAGSYRLRVTPDFAATGDFRFRLLDTHHAEALPLGAARSLLLDPGNSIRLFAVDGHVGDRLELDFESLAGGMASVQIIAADDPRRLLSAAAVAASPIGITLERDGAHLLIVVGRGDSDLPLTLNYSATLATPRVSPLPIGDEARGRTQVTGLADEWRFSLDRPTRLLVDGLTGAGNRWTLRGADRSPISSGSCDGNTLLVLDAGAYTLAVQADRPDELGAYAFRLLDFATATTLPLDQQSFGTLERIAGASLFRVAATQAGGRRSIDAVASNGERGVLAVFDPNGTALGEYALPVVDLADPAEASGGNGGERLLVVDGPSSASALLSFALTARQSTALQARPGETLIAALAVAGDRVSYRITAPFSEPLPAHAWIHDVGSRDVRWRLLPAGGDSTIAATAGWWPDVQRSANPDAYDWLVRAGDYELTIEATADNAEFALRLLAGETASALTASTRHGQLGNGRDVVVYRHDVGTAGSYGLQFDVAGGSAVQWALYDAVGKPIDGGNNSAGQRLFELRDLAVGQHFLVVSGGDDTPGAIDFDVDWSPMTVLVGDIVAGRLVDAEPIRSHLLDVAVGMSLQIHDQGSDTRIKWRLRPLGAPPDSDDWISLAELASDGSDREAEFPYLALVDSGRYTFDVSSDGPGDAAFSFLLLDLGQAPTLAAGETMLGFAAGEQLRAFRLDHSLAGTRPQLEIDTDLGEEIRWLLFDADRTLVEQGSSSATASRTQLQTRLYERPYTLELKRPTVLAGSPPLSARIELVASGGQAVRTVKLDESIAVSLDASSAYESRLAFSVSERSQILVDALSQVWDVDYQLVDASGRQLANSYLGDRDAPLVDLRPGEYGLRLYASSTPSGGDSPVDFSFRLLNAVRIDQPGLTLAVPVDATLAPGDHLTQVYRLSASAGDTVAIEVGSAAGGSAGGSDFDGDEVALYLFDPFGQLLSGDSVAGGPLRRTLDESGIYTVAVFAERWLDAPVDYAIAATLLAQQGRPTVASTPIALGTDVGDTLSGAPRAYRFTLTEPGLAVLGGRTGGGASPWWAHWLLRDAAGMLTGDHGYWNDFETATTPLTLPAGTYTLEVSVHYGSGNSMTFRIDGSDDAQQVDAGKSFGDSGAPLYQVDLAAGDEYLLQANRYGEWSIYRPDFSFAQRLAGSDVVRFVPSLTGRWYFVRGQDHFGPSTLFVEPASQPMSLGAEIRGLLAASGPDDAYQLTLTESKRLVLDLMELDAPAQVLLFRGSELLRRITAYSAQAYAGEPFELAAGEYRIEVHAQQAATAGTPYALRFLDLAAAPTVALNTEVASVLRPGETLLYRADLVAGTRLDYQPIDPGGLDGWWQLFDRDGNWVASAALTDPARLPMLTTSGAYFLALETTPTSALAGPATFRFAVQMPQDVTLGQRLRSEAFANSTHASYQFSVPTATRVLIDRGSSASGGDFAWRISRAGQSLAEGRLPGSGTAASDLPIVELPAGSYLLEIDAERAISSTGGLDELNLRLLDLAQAQALNLGVPTSGQRVAGEATLFAFHADAGDALTLDGNSGNDGRWWLVDEFGQTIANGEGSGQVAALPRSGSYTLLLDDDTGSTGGASTRSYDFRLSTSAITAPLLALERVITTALDGHGRASYRFAAPAPGALWLTPLSADFDAHVEVRAGQDAAAWRVHAADYFGDTRQAIVLPTPATYTLELRDAYGRANARPLSFVLHDLSAATRVTPGTAINGSIASGSGDIGMAAYRFSVTDGVSFVFAGDPASASGLHWRLLSPYGVEVAAGDLRSDGAPLPLTAGDYLLLIDNGGRQGAASYRFTLHTPPTSAFAAQELLRNATIVAPLAVGEQARYALHLDQPTVLVFDSLVASSGLRWRLDGPTGDSVFAQAMKRQGSTGGDFAGRLAAGEYTLAIDNAGSQTETASFRVVDPLGATSIAPGAPLSTRLTPAGGAQVFRFDALAGERYFLDGLQLVGDTSTSGAVRSVPGWQLLDPLGRSLFGPTPMGLASVAFDHHDAQSGQPIYRHSFVGSDQETATLSLSGSYTLLLDSLDAASGDPALVSFKLIRLPPTVAVVFDTFLSGPAPDLVISNLALTPTAGLQTGQTLRLDWQIENRGALPSAGNWHDRIVIRNLDSGQVVTDVLLAHDQAAGGSGEIAAGDSQHRSHLVSLPAGGSAAGRLRVIVMADADDVVRESSVDGANERNNAMAADIDVVRAPYSELHVEKLALDPAATFDPGAAVTVSWETVNRGTQAAAAGWSERLEVRNVSTRVVVASIVLNDRLGDGALAVDSRRTRSAQISWPGGAAAAGRFALRVIAGDTPAGADESFHPAEAFLVVGPDLQVRNLRVDTTAMAAGDTVTIRWEDWNPGASATATAFDEHIVVSNLDRSLVLLDTSQRYDPLAFEAGRSNGPIRAGDYRQRSFSFRLPDGIAGTGHIEIAVTVDQDREGFGSLFETNAAGDAE
ncbi:MAG: LEPR-XLL domain-containing protein, partial [Candidatus Accumulibacter sp.]|nr:LEPR-XLL domain-containing protein [Accumulibacter sp.]